MKIDTQVAEVITNATFDDEVDMTLDAESTPHIMNMLTNMYVDEYKAIAREYIANALDAMVAALGAKTSFGLVFPNPVEVTLPTRLNPTFTIRDHGTGMDKHVLKNVFPKYGASTKRKTNSQIGGFGLGAKSAFSVATNFVVTSVKDGVKHTVLFRKGENNVGKGQFLAPQNTTDGNGTVVSITLPDPERLSRIFNNSNLLLGFPAGSVSVNGQLNTNSVYNTESFTALGEAGWMLNDLVDWEKNNRRVKLHKNYNEKIVLVGPISYTFSKSELDDQNYGSTYGSLDDYTVVNLPIGSVDMTPARDTLIFSDKTKKAIVEGTKRLHKEVVKNIQTRFEDAPNRTTALDIAESLRLAGFNQEWKYKGEVVPQKVVPVFEDFKSFYSASGSKNTVQPYSRVLSGRSLVVYGVEDRAEAQSLNRFRKAFEVKHPGISDGFNLVFTTAKQGDLGKWLPAIAVGIYTPDEFETKGVELRKEINTEKRALRSGTTTRGEVNYGSLPVSFLNVSNSWRNQRPTVASYSAAVAAGKKHVVYIQTNDADTASLSHKIAALTARGSSVSSSNFSLVNNTIAFVKENYNVDAGTTQNDIAFVRVPANVRIESFLAAVPEAVSLDAALPVAVANFVAANPMTPLEVDIFENLRNDIYWTNAIGPVLGDIQNTELRTWTAAAAKVNSLDYSMNRKFSRFIDIVTNDMYASIFPEYNTEIESMNPEFLAHSDSDTPVSLIVEYLNFKFPATN